MSASTAEATPTLDEEQVQDYCSTLETMKESMAAARQVIKSLKEKCVLIP